MKKEYQEVPSLEEIEVSSAPSLEEIGVSSKEEEPGLLLSALIKKAERKEKKKEEAAKKKAAKLAKEYRLAQKKEEAENEKARKNCPYTGKRAWKNSLYALKYRNTVYGSLVKRSSTGQTVPIEQYPVCKVCGHRHR